MNEIRIPGALLLALLVFCAPPVSATTLTLLPDHATVAPGALLNIDIVLTGPAGGPAPSTGDFDFAVTYDPTFLKATAVAFGAALYVFSFHFATLVFPWLTELRGWTTLAAHLIFGITGALMYRQLARRPLMSQGSR